MRFFDLQESSVKRMKTVEDMREYRDASNRLSFDMGDSYLDFELFASKLTARFGEPILQVGGVDQCYWDYHTNGPTWGKETEMIACASKTKP